MNAQTILKGAELGLWDAEEMAAEQAEKEGKSLTPFSGGSLLDNPIIDTTRNDPFALGSACLAGALLIASQFGPEETFSDTAKRNMSAVGLLLGGVFVGRLTRGMGATKQLAEKDVSIHRLETLVDAMEYDRDEAVKEASKKTKRQIFTTGNGVIDVMHPMLGGNTVNARPEGSTPALGQTPIAMRRAETLF